MFESTIRRKHYQDTGDAKKAYDSSDLWALYKKQNKDTGRNPLIKDYFEELGSVRHVIAHAYLFEGQLGMEDHRIVSLKEKAIGGYNKEKMKYRTTPRLNICISPNQIGFKDAAVFYQTTNALLKLAGLSLPYALWKWDKTGEELEPEKWLNVAMNYLRFGKSKTWKNLNELIDNKEYEEFIQGLEEAGLELNERSDQSSSQE